MIKYSAEIKIAACNDYLSGKLSHREESSTGLSRRERIICRSYCKI